MRNLINEDAYEKRCKTDSYKLAKAYKKVSDSDFDDKEYNKYQTLVKKTGIPRDMLNKIQDIVTKTNGNFRPIDICQFWG